MKLRITFLVLITMSVLTTCFSQTVIKMKREGGISIIPCKVNGLNLNFIFDTGASDVSISMTEATFMLKNGYLNKEDILGSSKYLDATGSLSEGIIVILKEIEIAGLKLYNVKASIVKNNKAPLLLGQSAIGKLGKIQLDLETNTLTIMSGKSSFDFSTESNLLTTKSLNIGQKYQGGTIFYIDESGNHGLIVLDKLIWPNINRAVGTYNEAKEAINHLEDGWRMPSKEELNLLRIKKYVLKPQENYTKNSYGQLVRDESTEDDGIYWSSSICTNSKAWTVEFSAGEMTCREINYQFGIKAVKSF
jgi:clan AA aspartic protease (TIGR02281 family)